MEFPGMNRLAVQFLMVLKESPGLMAAIEHGPTHSLAAELLGVDTRGVGGNPQGALVVEACGLGDHPPRTEPNRQVRWHSDYSSDLAFRTALEPQGPGTNNAGLRSVKRNLLSLLIGLIRGLKKSAQGSARLARPQPRGGHR